MSLGLLTWCGIGAAMTLGVWLLIRVTKRKDAERAQRWAAEDAERARQLNEIMHPWELP